MGLERSPRDDPGMGVCGSGKILSKYIAKQYDSAKMVAAVPHFAYRAPPGCGEPVLFVDGPLNTFNPAFRR
jgi:hypothetical protein